MALQKKLISVWNFVLSVKKNTYKSTKKHLYINEWNFIDMYTILIVSINWTETMKETNHVNLIFNFLQ